MSNGGKFLWPRFGARQSLLLAFVTVPDWNSVSRPSFTPFVEHVPETLKKKPERFSFLSVTILYANDAHYRAAVEYFP